MKFVLAGYGSRGMSSRCAAVGRELLRRGHEVRMAVPPTCLASSSRLGLLRSPTGRTRGGRTGGQDFARIRGDTESSPMWPIMEHDTHVRAEWARR